MCAKAPTIFRRLKLIHTNSIQNSKTARPLWDTSRDIAVNTQCVPFEQPLVLLVRKLVVVQARMTWQHDII